MKKKITCKVCGHNITTMKGCWKRGMTYICRNCGNKVTRQKIKQLVERIKDKK